MFALLLLALWFPRFDWQVSDIDVLEANSVCRGVPCPLNQVIGWVESDAETRLFDVAWWRLTTDFYLWEWRGKFYTLVDGRVVRAKLFQRSFTVVDREVQERKLLPEGERKGL